MRLNIKRKVLSIPCDQIGRIAFFGIMGQTATLLAKNLRVTSISRFEKQLELEFSLGKCIVTETQKDSHSTVTAIFQQRFKGKIRNPKRFLESLRARLEMAICKVNEDSSLKMMAVFEE